MLIVKYFNEKQNDVLQIIKEFSLKLNHLSLKEIRVA